MSAGILLLVAVLIAIIVPFTVYQYEGDHKGSRPTRQTSHHTRYVSHSRHHH